MLKGLTQQVKGKPDPNRKRGGQKFGPGPPMQIVFAFGDGVNSYRDAFCAGHRYKIDKCPHCATAGQLVQHGVYWRKPRDGERVYRIPIQRWLCKACRHTISALPDFLLRYRWYLLAVISEVVVARGEEDRSWGDLAAEADGAPVVRTMQRWWQSLGAQAGRWLVAIEIVLAQQDSGSGWLDPHGEAARAPTAVQALLAASEHVLAWGKSRWDALAPYGWKDRLRFVWLWGHGQGLGRLI